MVDAYVELAAGGSLTLLADLKQLEFDDLVITCDTAGASLTFTDNAPVPVSRKFFLNVGINDFEDYAFVFTPGKNVTITATGGAVTLFYHFNRK